MRPPLRYRVRARLRLASTWVAVALVLAVVSSLLSAGVLYRDASVRCEQRIQSRAEIRQAITGAVDEIADYAALDDAERARVTERAEARVADELPPPDC